MKEMDVYLFFLLRKQTKWMSVPIFTQKIKEMDVYLLSFSLRKLKKCMSIPFFTQKIKEMEVRMAELADGILEALKKAAAKRSLQYFLESTQLALTLFGFGATFKETEKEKTFGKLSQITAGAQVVSIF